MDQRYSHGAVTHDVVMGKLTLLSKERFVFALRINLLSGICIYVTLKRIVFLS